MRRWFAALTAASAAGAFAVAAHAQCTYPVLTDDVPQTFTTSPTAARFVQSAGRWAGAAVRSGGSANWDVGFSVNTAAFPACLTLPVVASQQTGGIDFVLGDFAAQGTGTRYAPILKQSGTGPATLEWDSGNRTAAIGTAINFGNGGTNLIDVWNVNLVAGKSYSLFLAGNPGEFWLYMFQRAGANTWRQKSDAVLAVGSQYSGPWVFSPTVTGNYPIVVVNDANSSSFYGFYVQECTNPVSLADGAETYVPVQPGFHEEHFQITPTVPGFSTVALRVTAGELGAIGVSPRSGPGAFPPCDFHSVNYTNADRPTELVVGDFASGVLTLGETYWIEVGAPQAIGPDSWIEYDSGSTPLTVDGPTHKPFFSHAEVVKAYRADLTALSTVNVHVAKCDDAAIRIWIFRAFDTSDPTGQGWSSPDFHPPVAAFDVFEVGDFQFLPPVTGPYAFVITKDSGGPGCFELGLSDCGPRFPLTSGISTQIIQNPTLAFSGREFGMMHGHAEPWSAIAVRPNASNEDWNVQADESPTTGAAGPPMGCAGPTILVSDDPGATSHVDFLARVGGPLADLHDRVGTYKVFPVTNSTAGGGARVECEVATNAIFIDEPPIPWVVTPAEVIGVWNVFLEAGQPYTFWFAPGSSDAELFLFRDPEACAASCEPRFAKLGGFSQEFRTKVTRSFTPTQTGTYGVIAVNQNAATDTVRIGVYASTVDAGPPSAPALQLAAPRFESVAPNPSSARGALQFAYALPRSARVGFEIVDLAGRIVTRMDDADSPAGPNRRAWTVAATDGRALVPGVYFARMIVDGKVCGRQKIAIAR